MRRTLVGLLLVLVTGAIASAQSDSTQIDTLGAAQAAPTVQWELLPPTAIDVNDVPNDQGGHVKISWNPSPDDGRGLVDKYVIERSENLAGPFENIGSVAAGVTTFDDGDAASGTPFYYRVTALSISGEPGLPSEAAGPVKSSAQWFHTGRLALVVAALLLGGAILVYISRARAGHELFIRKIAGIEAVDEAIGRATEMGRKVYFVPGIQDMDNVQTIAGITILGRVARIAAEYEADLQVPVSRSLVMVSCREVTKEAYLKSGRPDSYYDDRVYYVTDDQFGYAAAIDGLVTRERPATMFYMGCFYAESLLLAETGNSIGAIQIAGTAEPTQLPFFVASCDYTLIGEELFAASAYMSREPRLLGSLKGQDVGKAIIVTALLVGVVWQTIYLGMNVEWFGDFARFFVAE
jgi:hypothetical protein